MFHKSRTRIVLSVMTALVVLLSITLATIYLTSFFSLRKENRTMLDRYVDIYSLEALPGSGISGGNVSLSPGTGMIRGDDLPPAGGTAGISGANLPLPPDGGAGILPPEEGELYRLSSFYSVAISGEDRVLATDRGNNGLYSEGDILNMAKQVLEKGKDSGTFEGLLYRVDHREDYTLVAFMDVTLTENSMSNLLLHTLITGGIAIGIFLLLSILLARRIIGPLEESDRRQKQFISDAEHELKTPVSVMEANAELLEREIGTNPWLSNIRYENERMGSLVRELLELSRVENGMEDTERIDLSGIAEQEILPFEGVAFEHGLTLKTRIAAGIQVTGNRNQLCKLISILIDNAISHAGEGKELTVDLTRDRRKAVLRVANPGKAIPDHRMEHLFDRFYRDDPARGEKEGQFGLGLSSAKAIVDGHKGEISAGCRDGLVIFTVSLPAD